MVDLSSLYSDPTLDAMKAAVEQIKASEPHRDYVGASQLGHLCERAVWYSYMDFDRRITGWKGCFAIEDGHRTESLIIERLRLVPGVVIVDRDENGKQLGFVDGKIKGHIDGKIIGLLQAPATEHVLEVKCCNEKKFENLSKLIYAHGEKDALAAWDGVFYAQAQIYMLKFGLKRHYLVCATPGGRDVISCRTELNANYAKSLLERGHRIASTKNPPARIGNDRDFFKCKMCDFNAICWSEK